MLNALVKLQTLDLFKKDEEGASLIEYSLLIGLISVVIITSIVATSGNLVTIWSKLQSVMATALNPDQSFRRRRGFAAPPASGEPIMMTSLIRFSKADDGASLIEYSLLIGMISAAIIASITAISGSMADLVNRSKRHGDGGLTTIKAQDLHQAILRFFEWEFGSEFAEGATPACGRPE